MRRRRRLEGSLAGEVTVEQTARAIVAAAAWPLSGAQHRVENSVERIQQ
jgi:hypothetical protein